jgi:two-component system, NtrC family, sensor histidine kinase HydH
MHVRVRLGIPDQLAGAPLPRRLAWVTGARLLLLTALLALVGLFYLRGEFRIGTFTVRVALGTLVVSFALTGIYATLLRSGRYMDQLAHAEIVLDQLTWTVIVYLSGGASSGATSLYGLSCLIGAILIGLRGATIAAVTGGACYAALVTAMSTGVLHPPPDQPTTLYSLSGAELTYYSVVNLLILVVVTLLAGYLAERLRMTGGQLIQAEERAEQAERMAALGRLAAGLAHEIRNPLGSIAGSVQLLKASPGLNDEDRQLCAIVQREAARLNDLVTDMMDLARPRKPNLVPVDAAQLAREVVELSTRSGRAVSDVEVAYAGLEHAPVVADAAQLRQLIWNLVRNAVQSSSAGDTVRLGIEAIGSGDLRLSVQDRGIGIADEDKSRLFDAFFTTRSQGTGVGLAVVKRIADEHGFSIEVESERGQGATFRVNLGPPRAEV